MNELDNFVSQSKTTSTAVAIAGSVDSGKCFAPGTIVMKYDGSFVKIENIKKGDVLMGDDSKSRIVLETHSGKGEMYKVTPNKGQSYSVNGEHILCLKYSNMTKVYDQIKRQRFNIKYISIEDGLPLVKCKIFNYRNKNKSIIRANAKLFYNNLEFKHGDVLEISVKNYLNLKKYIAEQFKWYRTGINFKAKELPLNPYMLGVWLGDGTSSKSEITSADPEIVKYFNENVAEFGLELHQLTYLRYTIVQINGGRKKYGNNVLNFLRDNKLLNNKHIPDIFKYNSRENRLKLLAGIIDTDGYYNKEGNYFEICMSANYERLVDDVIFLIRSLGFATYKKAVTKTCTNGKNGPVECKCFRFHFGGIGQDGIPCLLERKAPNERVTKKSNMVSGITIKPIGIGKYHGFQVDENGRFLLGDFSVAHNSSFVGVLISGELDDGNGSARKLVAKHPHEVQSGKTSDISTRIFDLPGINEAITLVDLCGHENYFKTTTFGVSGHFPDYTFLIVSANRGVLPMTKQHMRLLLSLSVAVMIVITHIDIAPNEIYEMTKDQIVKVCSKYGGKQSAVAFVNSMHDQSKNAEELTTLKQSAVKSIVSSLLNIPDGKQTIFPVVSISNKSGFFIDVVKDVMAQLVPRQFWLPGGEDAVLNNKVVKLFRAGLAKQNDTRSNMLPVYKEFKGGVFYCDSCFNPPGIGFVVTGINRGQRVQLGDTLYLGPFGQQFFPVRVRSLHNNMKQPISLLDDHHRGCIAIATTRKDEIKREQITKGVVLLSSLDLVKNICYRFKAVITLFTESITLKTGYSPVIHLSTIRQSARMIIDPNENGGSDIITYDGSTPSSTTVAIVTFKFKQHPEYVEPYNLFVLRSGDIQGIGLVIGTTPIDEDPDAKPDPVKCHRSRKQRYARRQPKK